MKMGAAEPLQHQRLRHREGGPSNCSAAKAPDVVKQALTPPALATMLWGTAES
jgi:hypothetical protein